MTRRVRQSLRQAFLARLVEEASPLTLDEVLDRAGGRTGGAVSFAEAAQAVRHDRGRR